jgi:hypothetical protein
VPVADIETGRHPKSFTGAENPIQTLVML